MSVLEGDVGELKIKSIIGFDGTAIGGLRMHPDGIHAVYPIGDKVNIINRTTRKQYFLSGHTNIISAIDISLSGNYIASGQINHIGFKALVIIWDFEKKVELLRHEVHKVRIESVAFTIDGLYLISLGGRDCSSVIVWDIQRNKPLCGTVATKGTQGQATTICITNKRAACFVTGGEGNLRVWRINHEERKLIGLDVNVAKLKRTITCMAINYKDELLYCGTTTGDLFKIRLNYSHDVDILDPVQKPIMIGCYARFNEKGLKPEQKVNLYSMGIRQILILDEELLLIGAGNGTINVVEESKTIFKPIGVNLPSNPNLIVLKTTSVRSMITSFNLLDNHTVLVGTVACEVYSLDLKTFKLKLIITCHMSTIFAMQFPHHYSDVFATASKDDVRIWNLKTMQELLRIKVPNFCCSSLFFTHDGKAIITGWNDGIIRAFTPLTGRLMYSILNAHNKGVSALAMTENDKMIVSGGCEGQVRAWSISPFKQQLICTLKEHKGPVSAIHINKFSDEAVSASTDGSCIIWDIVRMCRKQILFSNTLFMCVRYDPTAVHILTSGSNRKIAYWEVLDGSLIRELEGSTSAGLNSLDISPDGVMFVTGGNDQMIKLWKYQEGIITHIGLGHSAVVTTVNFSPNGKYIISASASGSIFVWECPFDVSIKEDENEKQQLQEAGDAKMKKLQRQRDLEKCTGKPLYKKKDVEENVINMCSEVCGELKDAKPQNEDVQVKCMCSDE